MYQLIRDRRRRIHDDGHTAVAKQRVPLSQKEKLVLWRRSNYDVLCLFSCLFSVWLTELIIRFLGPSPNIYIDGLSPKAS